MRVWRSAPRNVRIELVVDRLPSPASRHPESSIKLWNMRTQQLRATLVGHASLRRRLAYSADQPALSTSFATSEQG